MRDRRIPEMLGATEERVTLAGKPANARLSVGRPTGPAAVESAASPPRMYLNIENITGRGEPTSYSVYLNLPAGANPAEHSELYVGALPMFGVAEASQADRDHPGSGLHYALEVSEVVRTLQARNAWNPSDVRVTFVPKLAQGAAEEAALETSPIQIGRVSLYSA